MKYLLLITLCIGRITAYAQNDKEFIDQYGRETSEDKASAYLVKTYNPTDSNQVEIHQYQLNGTLLEKSTYQNFGRKTKIGVWQKWSGDGQLILDAYFNEKGNLEGTARSYFEDGRLRREDHFDDGKLVTGKVWDDNGDEIAHYPLLEEVSFGAEYMDWFRYLGKNVKYPTQARRMGIQGTVMVEFLIQKDGSVSDIKVISSPHESLSEETERVMRLSPKWNPQKIEGEAQVTLMTIPINFKLAQ